MRSNDEIKKIEKILDETIRPHVQNDGGDISVNSVKGNVVKINYKGACCGCPMASQGTLRAIEEILKEKYNPDTIVEIA